MKKLKLLFVLLLALFILPVAVFAEGEEEYSEEETTTEEVAEESREVPVYFFRGEGCPHCEEAEEWFASIEEEYGSLFNIVDYEVWYNSENAELMQSVADARGEEASGVPYIIVGNLSWNGFTSDYGEEILSEIKKLYDTEVNDRYDIMKLLPSINSTENKESSSNDVLALILILVIVGGVCFGVYKLREKSN